MKRLMIAVVMALMVAFGVYIYLTRPCIAGICFNGQCFNSSICFSGCTCLKKGMETMGYCYSSSRADQLIKQGWERLP